MVRFILILERFAALVRSPDMSHERPGTSRPTDANADSGGITSVDMLFSVLNERPDTETLSKVTRMASTEMTQFRMRYKFALDAVLTKIQILREEYDNSTGHSPITHVKHRLKTFDSLIAKANRLELGSDLNRISTVIRDIAGIRITCPYVADVYEFSDTLCRQPDLEILQVKDYITAPKSNGYRSLHLIVSVPVYMSKQTLHMPVEVQIRTIAMDFWASVEHEIRYKYKGVIPEHVEKTLLEVAGTATDLDSQMAALRDEVHQSNRTRPETAPDPTSAGMGDKSVARLQEPNGRAFTAPGH